MGHGLWRFDNQSGMEVNHHPSVHQVKEIKSSGLFYYALDVDYNPTALDGKHTEGVEPPKSNWALTLDEPPFVGYAVTCGITFTFGGLKITNQGEVVDTMDNPIPGLFAGGELVGGLFYNNYPGGAGLMAGSVFGKIAGDSAGKYVASG